MVMRCLVCSRKQATLCPVHMTRSRYARRPPGGDPADVADPRSHHGVGGGRRAGDLRAHRPARSGCTGDGRFAGVLDAGSQRRLAPGRWWSHRPHRADLGRDAGAVPARRSAGDDARAAGRVAQVGSGLPEPFRERAEAASSAVIHDSAGWSGGRAERPAPVHLDAVQSAVIAGRQIVLGYIAREGPPTTRTVHPLGLATKSGSWYLIAETDLAAEPSASIASSPSSSLPTRWFGSVIRAGRRVEDDHDRDRAGAHSDRRARSGGPSRRCHL